MRPMMLALSLVLGILPLLGIAWLFMNGMITPWPPSATVDGLFMSLILLTLSLCFLLNAYWEARDQGLIPKRSAKKTEVPAAAKAPAANAPAAKASAPKVS